MLRKSTLTRYKRTKRSKNLRCYLKRVSLFESLAAVLNDVESPVILFRYCTTSKWLMTQFGEYSTTLLRGLLL